MRRAVAPGGYAERPGPISTIGVAYNGTPESETALAVARGLAARSGASVRALLVVRPAPGGAGYWEAFDADPGAGVAEVMQAASDRLRLLDDVDGWIAVGVPSEALAAFGAEVDLLVVGSRSHGPVRRTLLGSTSLQLARAARCPLLVLPHAPSVHHEQSLAGPPPADLTAANNGQMRANSAGPIGRHVRDLKASHATGDAIPPASHALMVTAAISGSPLARGPAIHQP